jgi:hypothetical protein
MRIEVLYVQDCPNYTPAVERVKKVLASESLQVEVSGILVNSETEVQAREFLGSPTIRINGNDVEPEQRAPSLSCRLYANRSGVPSETVLRAAVLQAKHTESGGRDGMFTGKEQVGKNGPQPKGTVIASLAALGTVVLASSCCLPLLPFLFAAGAAGTSAFFLKVRPFFLAASMLFIAFGFYQAWRAKKCNRKPNALSVILLWFSAAVVVAFILFPQAIANFIANLVAG